MAQLKKKEEEIQLLEQQTASFSQAETQHRSVSTPSALTHPSQEADLDTLQVIQNLKEQLTSSEPSAFLQTLKSLASNADVDFYRSGVGIEGGKSGLLGTQLSNIKTRRDQE